MAYSPELVSSPTSLANSFALASNEMNRPARNATAEATWRISYVRNPSFGVYRGAMEMNSGSSSASVSGDRLKKVPSFRCCENSASPNAADSAVTRHGPPDRLSKTIR